MKDELFFFQQRAVTELRRKAAEALSEYQRTHVPQVLSLQAPTGAGKTIIMATLMEEIFFGSDRHPEEQQEAIFIWLSDSPSLNAQSRAKIDLKADKIRLGQCVTIADESFDREVLEDGKIYFLNTQKLGKAGNLGIHSDSRQYTIWETLTNTAREKSDRLYFIIDEAHRGMQGRDAGRATSIMQRFLKGEPRLGLPAMPLVIGISATADRFNALVGDTSSTLRKHVIPAGEVRSSGLLKERIVLTYPDDTARNDTMALLGAAAGEWKSKCEHWEQYCREQSCEPVQPVLIVQVLPGNGDAVSVSNLDQALSVIEERIGAPFQENEVVHTFGSTGTLTIGGLNVPHIQPEEIAGDRRIKVVFFKENLSTGWDCPRAETMMSFRKAEDATYIAQLLGRMVRTPLHKRIRSDESLNDVRLYLPYFNRETVEHIVSELQSPECGEIPADIESESLGNPVGGCLTVRPARYRSRPADDPGQQTFHWKTSAASEQTGCPPPETEAFSEESAGVLPLPRPEHGATPAERMGNASRDLELPLFRPALDREDVIRFINMQAYLTYQVHGKRINDYLKSLLDLAGLLTRTGIFPGANDLVERKVITLMRNHIEQLHRRGEYRKLAKQVRSFALLARTFDIFGESLDRGYVRDLFTYTESDLDRKLRAADLKLGGYGFPNQYGNRYDNPNDPTECQIDCILFAEDDECIAQLQRYAEKQFHEFDDQYRRYLVSYTEECKKQYDKIVADGDVVSKHNFCLPTTIGPLQDEDGKKYENHLFVDENTEVVKFKLNEWEEGVLSEEMKADDFVCWIRNIARTEWALCIPHAIDGKICRMYPDFLIVRRDPQSHYVLDILEPHRPDLRDNLSKAKGLAQYAKDEPRIGRVQLIRRGKDDSGRARFRRLDMAKGSVREKVLSAQTNEELDHIFALDGEFQ